MQPPLVQQIVDETPEIPEQGKVEMVFLDPFGEPMVGLEVEVEVDGKKEIMTTQSRGQIVYVTENEKTTLSVKNKHMDFKEKE
jgi:hypothetical protein